MKIVRVTYTVKPEYVEQNQKNIRKVMADLRTIDNPGINYNSCLGADGRTFTHTAFFSADENEKILLELPAFINFQKELRASGPEIPPKQELLTLVGSSQELF